MKFKTATMLMMAVFAISLVIPITASGSVSGGYPVTYRDHLPVLSPEAKIEERHQALGLIGAPVAGPTKGPGAGAQARPAQGEGFDWGDAVIGASVALTLTTLGMGAGVVVRSRRHRTARPAATA